MYSKSQTRTPSASRPQPNKNNPPPRRAAPAEPQSLEFNPSTNSRLNTIYKGFLKSQQRQPSATSRNNHNHQVLYARQHDLEEEYQIRLDKPPKTLKTDSDHPAAQSQMYSNHVDQAGQTSEIYALEDNRLSMEVRDFGYSESQQRRQNEWQVQQQVDTQLSLLKVRLQSVLFQRFQEAENNVLHGVKAIGQKTAKLQLRLSKVCGNLERTWFKIGQASALQKQNKSLTNRLKETAAKVDRLDKENKELKEAKDMERLRDNLHRARTSNSQHQQRGHTPGRDRDRFQVQRKLLLKQLVEAKRDKQTAEAETREKQIELDSIISSYNELLQFSKLLEEKYRAISQQHQRTQGTKGQSELYEQLREANQQLERSNRELDQKLEVLGFQQERSEARARDNANQIELLKKQLSKKQQELQKLYSHQKETQTELSTKIDILEKEARLRNQKHSQALSQTTTLKQKLEAASKIQQVLRNQISQVEAQLSAVTKEFNEKHKQQLNRYTITQADSQDQLQIALDQLAKSKTEVSRLKEELASLNKSHQLLNLSLQTRESELANLQNQLTAKGKQLQSALASTSTKSMESKVVNCLKHLLSSQEPKDLPENSRLVSAYLLQVYQHINKIANRLTQLELQNKKLHLHKNKLDHILHEDEPQIQYNQYQTTAMDAFYFRQKKDNPNDQALKEELRRVAFRLDQELEDNIKNKAEVIRLVGSNQEYKRKIRMAREALVRLTKKEGGEQEAIVLVSVLQVTEGKQQVKKILEKCFV